jgi:hypothetical protein
VRDEFTPTTKDYIAKRVGYLCSNPDCGCSTIAAAVSHDGIVNVGVAAHITAAAPGGPRYDSTLSREQRRHYTNGIWMCQTHGKLVDSDDKHFTVEMLRTWKRDAERRAFQALVAPAAQQELRVEPERLDAAVQRLIDRLGLAPEESVDAVAARLARAAASDLAVFKRVSGWPAHAVPLNLRMTDGGNERAFSVSGLAGALDAFNEITVIAPSGTGKTTTLIQVSDAILEEGRSVALFLPFGEWASATDALLQSVLRRQAFDGVQERHLMLLAQHGRLILLLDGWNELDLEARRRATAEIKRLRRDLPRLGIVISTRRQALDVPITGPVVQIDLLTEGQQKEIARALRGDQGENLLDQALRTPGVRGLVSIPLYLTTLLTHPTGAAMPTTKEAVLHLFVREHERSGERSEALRSALFGHHPDVVKALAVEATSTANTAISDTRARAVVRRVEDRLAEAGQITELPQPTAVLDLLVGQHTLVRSDSKSAVSFQHQQFQEWYASFDVEVAMREAAGGSGAALHRLRTEMLDRRAWEEPILFACERASRADRAGIKAVAAAVREALTIDPMLAAEMIYRSASDVWELIRDDILGFTNRWHRAGTVDRAARFMITSGRSEFAAQIWALIANPDSQVHLAATRAARRFRPSVLGLDAAVRIAALPDTVRQDILSELVMEGGLEGIELATSITRKEPSANIQFAVAEALLFRRADRNANELLGVASSDLWLMLAQKGYVNAISDPTLRERARAERERLIAAELNPLARIGLLLAAPRSAVNGEQIASIMATTDLPLRDQNAAWQVQRAWQRYPDQVASALLRRLEAGRKLPSNAKEMLRTVTPVDTGPIALLAIDPHSDNQLALFAASVIGPATIGALIDALAAVTDRLATPEGRAERANSEQYGLLKDRITAARSPAFIAALLEHGQTDQPHGIGTFADLLSQHGARETRHEPLALSEEAVGKLMALLRRWTETLLSSPNSKRRQLASVASAIGRLGRPELLPQLRQLLDADLSRWRDARRMRDEARADMTIEQRSDASHSWVRQYQDAFSAIGDDSVVTIMGEYLEDEDFAVSAALVLKGVSDRAPNKPNPAHLGPVPDFSDVQARRAERQAAGEPASPLAEMIFAAVERLMQPGGKEKRQHLAIALGRIGLSMPHGEKGPIIEALLRLPQSIRMKRELLTALVLDGQIISAGLVLDGVRAWIDDAREKTWMFDQSLWEAQGWLVLLPFTDRPAATIDGVDLLLNALPRPYPLEHVVSALGDAPGEQADQVLAELVRRHPRLVGQHEWVRTLVERGTQAAARILLDFALDGTFGGGPMAADRWWISQQLTALISVHPELEAEILRRYQSLGDAPGRDVIERVVAALGTAEAVSALVRAYAERRKGFDGLLQNAIHEAALSQQPAPGWSGAYELHPVPLPDLRKMLFGMLTDHSPEVAALAEACLTAIDELRDEYGSAAFEPRHPDVETGRPWPLAAGQ